MIKVYEITIRAVCIKDFDHKLMQQAIAESIDYSFNINNEMKLFHTTNKFKNYSFTQLKPFVGEGMYKKGTMVDFTIRVTDENLKNHFLKYLPALETEYFVLVTAIDKLVPKYKIDKLTTLSPIILKTPEGYWRGHYDEEYFLDAVNSNVIKKYNCITGQNIPLGTEVFESVVFKKEKIKRRYKNIVLIGDHCILKVKDNSLAQDIAYMSIATGVCHMTPRGFSTVIHQYRKEA